MTQEVIEELSVEQFKELSDTATKLDYDAVWDLIQGRILTTTGFEAAVNQIREGDSRPVYYSERKRMFDKWTKEGKVIKTKVGFFPNGTGKKVKQNVYMFAAAK